MDAPVLAARDFRFGPAIIGAALRERDAAPKCRSYAP